MAKRVLFLFILCLCSNFLLAQYPNCSLAARYYSKDSINITTFGASTVEGTLGLNFQSVLKNYLSQCYSNKVITINNYGIGGQTTTQGIQRFETVLNNKSGFLLILMGANDAIKIASGKEKLNNTINNMRSMVKLAKQKDFTVILGTLQYFNDKKVKSNSKINKIIEQINKSYKLICKEENVFLADINALLGKNFTLYHDDIHPNKKGYEIMSYVWLDAINKAIEDKFLLFSLSGNYPNPANSTTTFNYTVPNSSIVNLYLFDLQGRIVRNYLQEYENSGYYQKSFDVSDLQPGLYIYVMTQENYKKTGKMVVSR